ncbi:MAG: hypothetical protein AB7S70_05655 [Hyphomicrobium sp.]
MTKIITNATPRQKSIALGDRMLKPVFVGRLMTLRGGQIALKLTSRS